MTANSDKSNNWNNFEDVEAMERERPWEKDYTPPGHEIYQNVNGFLIPPEGTLVEIMAAREAEEAATSATVETSATETKDAVAPAAEPAPVAAPKRPAPQVLKPHQVRGPDGAVAGKAKEAKPKEDAVSRRYDIKDRDNFGTARFGCPNQDFIKPGFRLGTVGSRIAPGGVGKTWISLQEAMAIATGGTFCGRKYKRGAVIYLSADENKDEIMERCKSLYEDPDFTPEMLEMATKNLHIWYLVAAGPDLQEYKDDVFLFEEGLTRFVEDVMPFYEDDKLRLIIFDTLRRFSCADENSTNDMAQILTQIERIAKKFKCSCMFLHHMNKNSALKGEAALQQSARGASVLVDNIRYQEYLQIMSRDFAQKHGVADHAGRVEQTIGTAWNRYVEWGVAKQNSGQSVQPIWLQRQVDGTLKPYKIGECQAMKTQYLHSKSVIGDF